MISFTALCRAENIYRRKVLARGKETVALKNWATNLVIAQRKKTIAENRRRLEAKSRRKVV